MGVFYPDEPGAFWAFVGLTLMLGGIASAVAGRAVARAWQTPWLAVAYAAGLSLAVGFLHYALFGFSVIPAGAIASAAHEVGDDPAGAVRALASASTMVFATFAILCLFGFAGFRSRRAAQMADQYAWLYVRRGPFGWRTRDGMAQRSSADAIS